MPPFIHSSIRHLSIHLSIYTPVHLSIHSSLHSSTHLFIQPPVHCSCTHLLDHLLDCLFTHSFTLHPPAYLSIPPSLLQELSLTQDRAVLPVPRDDLS